MSLEMSNITQLQSFRKLLESFPMLQHLSVAVYISDFDLLFSLSSDKVK
jgi:hypothetical protein